MKANQSFWKRGIFALLLLGLVFPLGAAQKYPLYQVGKVPVIDGKLNDRVWTLLPEGRGFHNLDAKRTYATSYTTSFQMGWKGDKLYMAFECKDPNLKGIKAVDSYRDGWSFDDSVEIFFQKKGAPYYTHLMINAKGARWAKRSDAKHDMEIPLSWKAVAGRTKDAWTLETELPLSILGVKSPDDLTFNVGRNIPALGKFVRHQSWAKVFGGFGHVPSFAKLVKKPFHGPADVTMANNEINYAYDYKLYLDLLQIARSGRSWKNVVANYGLAENFSSVKKLKDYITKNLGRLSHKERIAFYTQYLDAVKAVSVPARKLAFSVKGKNIASSTIYVDGKEMKAVKGKIDFVLKEGLTVISAKVKAGKNAKIAFDFPGYKILNTRWSYSKKAPKNWMDVKFDDRSWKALNNGTLPEGEVYLRQLVLWNKVHTGNFRCINPTVREWNISLASTEVVYHSIYSPAGHKVNTYDFVLDLPKGFRLLDMAPGARRNRLSLAPESVKTQKNANGSTTYTLRYKQRDIHPWQTADSLLGIYKDASGKAGDKYTITYARLINSNMTEIDGKIPFTVLPRINGKTFRKMIMSYYMGGMPQGLSDEFLKKVVSESVKAGVDLFSVSPFQRKDNRNGKIIAAGGKLMLGFLNHPVWGSKIYDSAVTDLIRKNKELLATYYDGKILTVEEQAKRPSHKLEIRPCPTVTLTKYKKEFFNAVRKDYKELFFDKWPSAKYTFINWEQEPWMNSIYVKSTNPVGVYCFCKHCKNGFYKYAKIPKGKTLANKEIFEKYYEEWRKYKYTLDAAMHSIVNNAIKSLGKKVFFYSWSNHFGYWEAVKNVDFHLFLGCPGNGTADGRQQVGMDEVMKFHMGKMGRRNITGQRFVFFPQTYGWNTTKPEGWLKFNVMSNDGFIDSKSWKTQSVRIFAAQKGGYDLQNPLELVSGIKYYVGEATRMAAKYEDFFWDGKRNDKLASSKNIKYPDLLVLEKGKERLVLLFNEGDKPKKVTVNNLKLAGQKKAFAYYLNKELGNPASVTITIPAKDMEAIHIR